MSDLTIRHTSGGLLVSNVGGNASAPGNSSGQSKRTWRDPQVIAAIITGILGLAGVLAGILISNHSSASPQSMSQKLNISVACKIPAQVHSGEQITATYTIRSNQPVKVGLGAGVYDSGDNDHSTGAGDQDGYQLAVGTQTVTRIIALPTGLAADHYEIDAEIWPNGKIGANGANTLAEATCGTFNVPQ